MAEDNFQNQAYSAFDSYLNEATTFNLAANTMENEAFNNIRNPVYADPLICDEPMAFNAVANDITASTNFDIFFNQVCPCDLDFDEPMTLNTWSDNQAFPHYTSCDSDGNEPLTLNLATSTVTGVGDAHDNQNLIFPDFDEATAREFQGWKKSWDEKMLLLHLKREGIDWRDPTKTFGIMKARNCNARKTMLQRADREINALFQAALADREGEADRLRKLALSYTLGDAAKVDYDGLWDRISKSMQHYGSKLRWSSYKVKYAWNSGVSDLFPHIILRQRKVLKAILI